ncbi:MAG TPA: GNAT family N-acetyltransferase [Solirubrobacterales bacterium]|nr:GNAT family N-acetyltransferase [Solirubrobacterales bacterium]
MSAIRPCRDDERAAILAIVNSAAEAYRGVIPADRWHDPYMEARELDAEIAAGVEFWGYEADGELIGAMGIQRVGDVDLIRHAYVLPGSQRRGVGAALLGHLRSRTDRRMLVGTWAAAEWAIRFYERHRFELVTSQLKEALLRSYWTIPDRQIETSVVLADPPFDATEEARLREAGQAMAAVDLFWLPLGAGGHFVRLNGRLYEALAARIRRRPACDLYHSALEVRLPEARFVIEQAPVHDWSGEQRGVVAEGPVGARWAGRFRIFRYEIRLWRDGHIPDVAEAVDSPRLLATGEDRARRVLETVARVPTPVWGRDELGTGEMWNSNSVVAWVIARSGLDAQSIEPPAGGRASGWRAGLVAAAAGRSVSRP